MPALVAIALLFTFGVTSLAQAESRLGLRGGLNVGNIKYSGTDTHDPATKQGVILSALIQGSLISSRFLYLQAELSYVDRGWVEDAGIGVDEVSTYFIVPELAFGAALVLRRPTAGVVPFLEAGVDYAAVLRSEAFAEYRGTDLRGKLTDYSSFNTSLNIGAGVALPVRRNEFQLILRYSYGLMNMFNTLDDVAMKTTGVQFMAGYLFTLHR